MNVLTVGLAVCLSLFLAGESVAGTAQRKEECSGNYAGPLATGITHARENLSCDDWYTAIAKEKLKIPTCDQAKKDARAAGRKIGGVCREQDSDGSITCWDMEQTTRFLGFFELRGAMVSCPIDPNSLLRALLTQYPPKQ